MIKIYFTIILLIIIILIIIYNKNYINNIKKNNYSKKNNDSEVIYSKEIKFNDKYNPRILSYEYDYHGSDKNKLIENIKKNILKENKIYNKNLPEATKNNLNLKKIDEVDRFLEWLLLNKIDNITNFINNPYLSLDIEGNQQNLYNFNNFKVVETWGLIYNEGVPKIKEHNYFPFCLTFIYYINIPDKTAKYIF